MRQVFSKLLLVATTAVISHASVASVCAQRPEEVLSGKWKLDSKKSIDIGGEQARPLLGIFTKLDIEFRKDGTSEVITGGGKSKPTRQTGTWKVLKSNGRSFDLQMNTGSSGHKELFKVTLLEAGDYLQLAAEKNQPIQFVIILARVKPKN